MLRRKRPLIAIAAVLAVIALLVGLDRSGLLQLNAAQGTDSMAPGLPPCNGFYFAEGFTYRFRDPRRGEIVFFHARGTVGGVAIPGTYIPDPDSRDLQVTKRVIGVPGDTVIGRGGRVYVNGRKADDVPTGAFRRVHLGADEYFLLGDNRSISRDSRWFGVVPRRAIYARAVLNVWPLRRFGIPRYDRTHVSPGRVCG
jgi:signal peptidase I